MANVNNQPWVNYMSYLDPSYWQNAMQPAINQAATAFQPVAPQPNPMTQNANLQALPGANPTAPRYTFDRSSLQTGFYDPNTRLNNFLQLLQQARSNLASPPENYVTPPASPLNAYNVNTPVPVSQASLEPKKMAAPAPAPAALTTQQLLSLPIGAFSNVKDYARYVKNREIFANVNLFRR